MPERPKVVVVDSQSPADVEWTARFVVQLRVLKDELTIWDEGQILPGDDRETRLKAETATAKVAVVRQDPPARRPVLPLRS